LNTDCLFWQKDDNKCVRLKILVITLILATSFLYFQMHKNTKIIRNSSLPEFTTNTISPTPYPTVIPTAPHIPPVVSKVPELEINNAGLTEGKLHKLDADYKLFLAPAESYPIRANYYEAGSYKTGELEGYKKLIVLLESNWMSPQIYNFVTKDFKEFKQISTTTLKGEITNLNPQKVTGIFIVQNSFPEVIKLSDKYILTGGGLITEKQDSTKVLRADYEYFLYEIADKYPEKDRLESPNPAYRFYGLHMLQSSSLRGRDSVDKNTIEQYFDGYTNLAVIDDIGIPRIYSLTTPAHYQKNQEAKKVQKFPEEQHLNVKATDIDSKGNFYGDYKLAFPTPCGRGSDAVVLKNVKYEDFVKIGQAYDIDLFVLKDQNHLLNKLQYSINLLRVGQPEYVPPISFEDYVLRYPLLFFKDYWGRWVVIGETQYDKRGGCGKPVIYFYPENPIEVTVKFNTAISLTTQIPVYHDGWKMLAQPGSKLTDLQPQYTLCNAIDTNNNGSEYGRTACEQNNYPYIYWSGNVLNKHYPEPTTGWIVSSAELPTFMSNILDKIGLNSQEKSDMLEFWLPHMLGEHTPYYQISFLLTTDLNNFIPLDIKPKPDSMLRIFLDYKALSIRPEYKITEPNIGTFVRRGFTVVEWGGLLR
jgi:hypothetical protein